MTDNSPSLSKDYEHGSSMPFLSRHPEIEDFVELKKLVLRIAAMIAMWFADSGDYTLDFDGYYDYCRSLFRAAYHMGLDVQSTNFKISIDEEDKATQRLVIAVQYVGSYQE